MSALAAGLSAAVGRGAGLTIDGCTTVHLAADSSAGFLRMPSPACGVVPGHLSIDRLRAVHEPMTCGKCARMVRAGQSAAVPSPAAQADQPTLPGCELVAA